MHQAAPVHCIPLSVPGTRQFCVELQWGSFVNVSWSFYLNCMKKISYKVSLYIRYHKINYQIVYTGLWTMWNEELNVAFLYMYVSMPDQNVNFLRRHFQLHFLE